MKMDFLRFFILSNLPIWAGSESHPFCKLLQCFFPVCGQKSPLYSKGTPAILDCGPNISFGTVQCLLQGLSEAALLLPDRALFH